MTDAPPPESLRPSWGAAGWALVLAAFAVGFAALPLKTIGPAADHLPGDPADNRLNNYILEHGYRYVTGREASFWNAPMFYPAAGATRTSDAHIGMLPFYTAMRTLGMSPEGAFQGYFLLPFVLNFTAAAWGVRRLGFGPVAAAVGAYVFTFPLSLAGQLAHAQLFPRFLVPPAIVFGWEFLREPRSWRAGAAVGCVVGQTYLSVYIGYFLALLMAGGLLSTILCRHSLPWRELMRPGRKAWTGRIAAAVVGALALSPLLYNHARGGGGAPRAMIRELAPEPRAWISPPSPAAVFPRVAESAGVKISYAPEQQLLPGVLTLAALPVGLAILVRRGRLDARWAAVATAAVTVLALALFVTRYHGVWLYEPLTRLPGVRGVRAVGRVVLVCLFPAGLVLGACAEALATALGRLGRPAAACGAVLAVGAVAADHWLVPTAGPRSEKWWMLRVPKDDVVRRQADIGAVVRHHPAPRLLYVFPAPPGSSALEGLQRQCEAMRAAQDAGIPCVNGWSGYLPDGWYPFPSYRPLFQWLTGAGVRPDEIAGLVLVGEAVPDRDPQYEATMRAAYPVESPR